MIKLNKKFQLIDYHLLEDEKARDRIESSIQPLFGYIGFQGVYFTFVKLLPIIFSIIIYLSLTLSATPVLGVICICSSILSIMINGRIRKTIEETKDMKSSAYRQKMLYNKIAYDADYGKDIRIFSITKKLMKYYKKKSQEFILIEKKIINKEFSLNLIALLINCIRDILSYILILYLYFSESLTIGEFTLFVEIIIVLSTDLETVLDLCNDMIKCLTSSHLYKTFLDSTEYETKWGNKNALQPDTSIEIEFKNVSFSYPNSEKPVLDHMNLTIKNNEKVAIVGLNGAGKTTLIKVLLGLQPITSGTIYVNGVDMKTFKKEEYLKMFSVVFQDVHVFATSLIENVIGYQEDGISNAQKALENAGLQDLIETLPYSYDTQLLKVLDDEGVVLSGGEMQKLSIARALYKNGNIIILDEPTAALDALAEAKIYEDFNKLTENKTSIFISHRLTSTKFCDNIVLMENGRIKEYGSHEQLLAQKGDYFKMFNEQGKYYKECECDETK